MQMLLIPLDSLKTMMQVEGSAGTRILLAKLKEHGVVALWDGATVAALSMIATHYPWYLSFNYLNAVIPSQTRPWRYAFDCCLALAACLHERLTPSPACSLITPSGRKILRSAFIGFVCTGLGDLISNTFKVRFKIHELLLGSSLILCEFNHLTPGCQNPTANSHQQLELLPTDPTRGGQRWLGRLSHPWFENQVRNRSKIANAANLFISCRVSNAWPL
jgi:hypothetical protein